MPRSVTYNFKGLKRIVNDIFYPLFESGHRYLNLMGGAGSGKSVFAAQKVIKRILCERGHNIIVLRKVAKTIRASCWMEILNVINEWNVSSEFKVNNSDRVITHLASGNLIQFAGLDDVEKMKSLYRPTGFWIEEATELMPHDFEQIDIRLRGKMANYKQIILSYNPISESHWLRDAFFKSNIVGYLKTEKRHEVRVFAKDPETGLELRSLTLVTTFNDNRFMEPEDCTRLRSLKDNMHKVYALAEWGILEGLIYHPLIMEGYTLEDSDNPDSKRVWHNQYPLSFDSECYGLDFGYTDPTALIHVGWKDGELYETEKYYRTQQTTDDLIVWMLNSKISKETVIWADSAEPDRIEMIRRAGYNIHPVDKRAGSVMAGINLCQELIIHGKEENVNLNAEHNSYQWKKDKDGNGLDVPKDKDDHIVTARRYAVYGHLNDPAPEAEFFTI